MLALTFRWGAWPVHLVLPTPSPTHGQISSSWWPWPSPQDQSHFWTNSPRRCLLSVLTSVLNRKSAVEKHATTFIWHNLSFISLAIHVIQMPLQLQGCYIIGWLWPKRFVNLWFQVSLQVLLWHQLQEPKAPRWSPNRDCHMTRGESHHILPLAEAKQCKQPTIRITSVQLDNFP